MFIGLNASLVTDIISIYFESNEKKNKPRTRPPVVLSVCVRHAQWTELRVGG